MSANPSQVLNGKRRRDGPVFTDGQIQGRQAVARAQVREQLRISIDRRTHRLIFEWNSPNQSLTEGPAVEHGQAAESAVYGPRRVSPASYRARVLQHLIAIGAQVAFLDLILLPTVGLAGL
jgi:hypothetical protein